MQNLVFFCPLVSALELDAHPYIHTGIIVNSGEIDSGMMRTDGSGNIFKRKHLAITILPYCKKK